MKDLDRHLNLEDRQMAYEHMEDAPYVLGLYRFERDAWTSARKTHIQNTGSAKHWSIATLTLAGEDAEWC